MPIVRRTGSVLGNLIVNDIKDFVYDNAKAMESDREATVEQGAEALAHAISYGISKALSNKIVKTSFAAGICPPGGGPVGDLIFIPLEQGTREP